MEHIAAFMLLVSCSSNHQTCEEVNAPQPAYETLQQCNADVSGLKIRQSSNQLVLATCVAMDPALIFEDAQIVWEITQDGRLKAEILADAPQQIS